MSSSYEFEDPVSDKLQAVKNEEDEVGVVTSLKDEGALKVAVPQTLPEDGVVGMKSILKKVLKCLKKGGGGGGEEEEEEEDDDYEEEDDDYEEEEEEDYDEEEDDDVGIIGVYGMGGVGKTTLLDQIKEKLHREMKNDFDVVIWVVVSRDLQHDKIQQQIGEQIGLFDDKAWKHKNSVKKALVISNILKEKKFVLLMDDLWGRVDLTKVGVPLPSPENSSKIVFTTRSLQICSLMEADKLFKVTCLSDNDAWKLFKALVGDETLRSHREDSIARACRECHGLPLALVSIGQTVRKKPPEEWDDLYRVLRGWTTSNSGSDDQLKKDIRDNLKLIRNNLKLSYDILQNDMFKSCFLYCCLFPTYLRIKKQDLIDYWIGEGFLDERLGAVQSRGHYIIDVFLSVCLLEQSGFDDSYVKMNYWIRDMSLWIASEIETEKGNCVFFHDIDNFKDDENLKKATRISFPPFEFNDEVMKKLPGPPTCPLLQTLFLIRNRSEVIRNAIRKDHYFNFMPSLKVLNLSLNSWLTELPSGILKLISLQHLDLSGTKIEKLPKELTVLKILKCLNLEETRSLSEIPRQLISEFSMLHVLRLRQCGFMLKPNEDTVVSVSKEDGVEFNDAQLLIEELLYLKNLSMLSITLNNSHALQRLLSSNRLQSCIQSLRLQDLRHPKSIKVSLTDLKHLNTLEISNCEYLEELEVDFVGEAQDVGESPCSFYFLHELIISKCRKLRELTWLILAPNLKHLRISNCAEMEEMINVGKLSECPELMGNVIPFSKLKFLTLKYLPKLRSIYWSVLPFPDLKEFAITDCPMLLPLPPNLLNKVYVLPVEPSSVENPANRAKQVIASGGSGKSLEVPSNRDVSAKSAKLKIVIKLQVKNDKCRSKAMKIVAGEDGVMSVSWEGQDKDTMVVTGDGVDAVALTVKLSKKLGFAKLLSEEYVTSHYRKMTGGTGKSKVPSKRTYLPEMAEEAKAKGNAAFSAGDYSAAKRHFTDAIALAPTNHVLYSNRSAAHAFLHNYADAKTTVEIKPDWPKGYSRLGAAHLGLQNHAEAISAYKKGLANNEALKSGLADAQAAVRSRTPPSDNPLASAFSGPEMWTKLTADPSTRSFLQQPDFGKMMQEIQKNPDNLNLYLKDHRVMQALGVLLNVKLRGANGGDEMEMEQEFPNSSSSEPAREEKKPAPQAAPEPEPEPMESTEEDREAKERKEKARREKEAGNAADKKKDFDTAIDHYTKALELDDEDISYLTNRAAVYLEMGKYEECIKDCDKAVERGRELRADFKTVARALTRKGTAQAKMAKCSKDYDLAIEIFQKALTEHRNPDTLKRLNDAEKAKKELEQQEFFDPKIADEEREKGNEYFKQQKYPEAVKHYTESLRRNPKDPRTYSNRAACYTKLGPLPEGLKDAEKCIELDPTFSKGYTRKGAVQFFMKEYDKAIETYQEGLKHDPQNQELIDGVRRCVEQINKAGRGELSAR